MAELSHNAEPLTLAVDCGGGGIKATVLDSGGFQVSDAIREVVRYPLTPDAFVSGIRDMASRLPQADRVTVGMPGMIRHGVVIYTPHYICRAGPRTRILPELEAAWTGLDVASAFVDALELDSLVLNDAEVAAAGVVMGRGSELVLTLGTGLGSALVDNGVLAPHLEFSHAPMKWGLTFDDVLGEHERRRLGDSAWSRRVLRAIELLEPVVRWERLYLGGGNSSRLSESVTAKLGPEVSIVPNVAGMTGGVRAWSLAGEQKRSHS